MADNTECGNFRKFKTEFWVFLPFNQEIIFNNGEIVVLPFRLSRCLEALISRNGEILDYDNLLQEVWQTEHRESSTISSVISELRKVIGCNKNKLTFIKTIPKKGYRFVMPFEVDIAAPKNDVVSKAAINNNKESLPAHVLRDNTVLPTPTPEEPLADNQPQTTPATEHKIYDPSQEPRPQMEPETEVKRFKNTYSISAAMVSILILTVVLLLKLMPLNSTGGAMLYMDTDDRSTASEVRTNISNKATVLRLEKGNELEFYMHANTYWLFYTHQSSHDDYKLIKAKSLITGEVFSLGTQEAWNYASPKISPAGDKLVYIRNSADACEVRLVSFSETGFNLDSDRKLTSCNLPGDWSTPDFSADGAEIFFAHSESHAGPYNIYRYDLATGHEWLLASSGLSERGDLVAAP